MTLQPIAIDFIFVSSLNNLKSSDKIPLSGWLEKLKSSQNSFKWANTLNEKLNNNTISVNVYRF